MSSIFVLLNDAMTETDSTFANWQALLNFVTANAHSDFYKERFQTAGFDPSCDFKSLTDIERIPLLTKAQLLEAGEERLRFVPEEQIDRVSTTSGTTSKKPLILFHARNPSIQERHKESDHRALILFSPLRGGQLLQRARLREQYALLGDIHNIPTSFEIASRMRIDQLFTTPTVAILARKHLDNFPMFAANLKHLRLAGEVLTANKRRVLHELYPDMKITMSYSSSEQSRMATQCDHLADQTMNEVMYHPFFYSHYFEIIDPQTGKVLPSGERGELVVTNFQNLGSPLIRYRTGDLANFVEKKCPCSEPSPLLQVWGRAAEDSVRAGGFDLRREMLEIPILKASDMIRNDFEVHVYEDFDSGKPSLRIELNLALHAGIMDTPLNHQRVEEVFKEHWRLSPSFNVKKALVNGLVKDFSVTFTDFPHNAKATERMILH